MISSVNRYGLRALGLFALIAVALLGASSSAKAADTVTISGNAWAFVLSGSTSGLEGATIGIAEYPDLKTTSGPDGAWSLEVPDNASITPFAASPGRYPTYDQTFYTRGKDLNQVNFQMPPQSIAEAFAVVVGASTTGEAGSKVLDQCAIVSTVFQKEGRNFFDFNDFLAFAPHGVEDSTAEAFDSEGQSIGGPIYFNKDVIPDPSRTGASRDGGMVWSSLPEGTYTVTAQHPTARFAPFQATCKPGRLVNASPPWGLYEMARTEEPNPAVLPAPKPEPESTDNILQARVLSAKVVKNGPKKRNLKVRFNSGEEIRANLIVRQDKRAGKGKRTMKRGPRELASGKSAMKLPLPKGFRKGSLGLEIKLADKAGNAASFNWRLWVPGLKK